MINNNKKGIVIVVIVFIAICIATYKKEYHSNISTNIIVESSICLFEDLKINEMGLRVIKIKNTENKPLVIYTIEKSNSGVIVEQDVQYFPKLKNIEIRLGYSSNKLGKINEWIRIKGNFQNENIVIPIKGNIIE